RAQLPRCQHAKKLQRQGDLISHFPWHPLRAQSVWRRPVGSGPMRLRACPLFRFDATRETGGRGEPVRLGGKADWTGHGTWVLGPRVPPKPKKKKKNQPTDNSLPLGREGTTVPRNAHPSPSAHARGESPADGPVAPRWGAGARLRP